MRRVGLAWFLGELLAMSVVQAQSLRGGATAPPPATAAAPLVIRGVTVIDVVTGRHLVDRTVVIVGNRIRRIEPTQQARSPAGARVVNGRGKYLIPGLWDMHVHPHAYVDIAYPLFIANGITGVRDAGSSVPLATLVQWKREIAAGTRVGPRLLVSGPAIDQASDSQMTVTYWGDWRHHIQVPQALLRQVVDSLHAAGADALKLYSMSRDMRLAMAEEARRVGVPFGGHSAETSGIEFSDGGASILDHSTWTGVCGDADVSEQQAHPYDLARCAAVVRQLRHNNTWILRTPVIGGPLVRNRMWRYQPHSLLATMPAEALRQIHQAGVATDSLTALEPISTSAWMAKITEDPDTPSLWEELTKAKAQTDSLRRRDAILPVIAGTDMSLGVSTFSLGIVPGFSLPPVLMSFVLGGMTPLEALQTATLNPVLALRATDSLGTVAEGKIADLVLLDADPLADIWHTTKIRGVVANGRYYDRAMLDGLLQMTEQAARQR